MLRTSILALLLAASPASPVYAQLDRPSNIVTAEGRATVYHGDAAGARDRAISAALLRGLEQYAGLRITSSTLIDKGELVARETRAHSQGWVESYSVLDVRREPEELVVTVRLVVAPDPVDASFRRLLASTSTVLLVEENNLGRRLSGSTLLSILDDPFFASQLNTPSRSELAFLGSALPHSFFAMPDATVARELGLRWMSGMVIVARASTKELATGAADLGIRVDPAVLRPVVAAEGDLWVLSGSTGDVLLSHRFEDVRGSDAASAERAGQRALNKLGSEMRRFLVDQISRLMRETGYPLRVKVSGAAAANGALGVRRLLEASRWVDRVSLESESPRSSVIRVTCRESPVLLVEELRHADEIEIVRFDSSTNEIEVR